MCDNAGIDLGRGGGRGVGTGKVSSRYRPRLYAGTLPFQAMTAARNLALSGYCGLAVGTVPARSGQGNAPLCFLSGSSN